MKRTGLLQHSRARTHIPQICVMIERATTIHKMLEPLPYTQAKKSAQTCKLAEKGKAEKEKQKKTFCVYTKFAVTRNSFV